MFIFSIDRENGIPLSKQIFDGISFLILRGTMRAGDRLPSTRSLAEMLGISRNVTIEAYERLAAEGFLRTGRGSGTFIAEGIRIMEKRSESGSPFEQVGFEPFRTDIVDFRSGLPDMRYFPRSVWLQLTRKVFLNEDNDPLVYHQPEGSLQLRAEIAAYVNSRRGACCRPEQIIITSGTTQAIGLVSRLLISSEKSTVFLEDPITCDIRRIIGREGGNVKGVPVACDGMRVPPAEDGAAFLYTTPSHQFPLGVTMPVQKRTALIAYARSRSIYIVEDDYDSEFRFDGPPLSCMQGLAPEQVVYIGTFSKTLCPAFRIGYLILPPVLVNEGRRMKWFTDLHSPIPNQIILAEFMKSGRYTRHITRMRKIYRNRRLLLERELRERFGQTAEIIGSRTGIHLCARFKGSFFSPALLERLESAGVKVYPVEIHSIEKGRFDDTIILGYGCISENDILNGVRVLHYVLRTT